MHGCGDMRGKFRGLHLHQRTSIEREQGGGSEQRDRPWERPHAWTRLHGAHGCGRRAGRGGGSGTQGQRPCPWRRVWSVEPVAVERGLSSGWPRWCGRPSSSWGLRRGGEEAGRPGAFPAGGQGRGSGRAGDPLKLGLAGLGRWKPDGGRGGRLGLHSSLRPAGPCPDLREWTVGT